MVNNCHVIRPKPCHKKATKRTGDSNVNQTNHLLQLTPSDGEKSPNFGQILVTISNSKTVENDVSVRKRAEGRVLQAADNASFMVIRIYFKLIRFPSPAPFLKAIEIVGLLTS